MSDNPDCALADSRAYYQALQSKSNEWDVLDQGPEMTALRHEFVCNQLRTGSAARVLDYGCGTGQILPKIPTSVTHWDGHDHQPERQQQFLGRLQQTHMSGSFSTVQTTDYLLYIQQQVQRQLPDTLVLCGILGYEQFTHLQGLVKFFRGLQIKTVLTIPVVTPGYSEQVIHRFTAEECAGLPLTDIAPGIAGLVIGG